MYHVSPALVDDTRLHGLRRLLAADAARLDDEACFPTDNLARLQEAGLLALTVPQQYGGGGAGLLETSRVLGILAEGCASTTLILAMQLFKQAALARSNLWPDRVQARVFAEAI